MRINIVVIWILPHDSSSQGPSISKFQNILLKGYRQYRSIQLLQRDRQTPLYKLCKQGVSSGLHTLIHTASLRKLNGTGGSSAACLARMLKSMESFSSRGGVPVLSLLIVNPSFSKVWARPMEGWSPIRPAGCASNPMRTIPLRKVPVVRITLPACTFLPSPEEKKIKIWCGKLSPPQGSLTMKEAES